MQKIVAYRHVRQKRHFRNRWHLRHKPERRRKRQRRGRRQGFTAPGTASGRKLYPVAADSSPESLRAARAGLEGCELPADRGAPGDALRRESQGEAVLNCTGPARANGRNDRQHQEIRYNRDFRHIANKSKPMITLSQATNSSRPAQPVRPVTTDRLSEKICGAPLESSPKNPRQARHARSERHRTIETTVSGTAMAAGRLAVGSRGLAWHRRIGSAAGAADGDGGSRQHGSSGRRCAQHDNAQHGYTWLLFSPNFYSPERRLSGTAQSVAGQLQSALRPRCSQRDCSICCCPDQPNSNQRTGCVRDGRQPAAGRTCRLGIGCRRVNSAPQTSLEIWQAQNSPQPPTAEAQSNAEGVERLPDTQLTSATTAVVRPPLKRGTLIEAVPPAEMLGRHRLLAASPIELVGQSGDDTPAEAPAQTPPGQLPDTGIQSGEGPNNGPLAPAQGDSKKLGKAPVDYTREFLRTQSVLLRKGQLQFDTGAAYGTVETGFPTIVNGNLTQGLPRRRLAYIPLQLRYGLTDRIQMFANMPVGYVNNEQTVLGQYANYSGRGGTGDLNVGHRGIGCGAATAALGIRISSPPSA